MNQVANNLLHSVIEFFGILLPGVIFAYLHSTLLLAWFTLAPNVGVALIPKDSYWIVVFIVSLVLGHLLHAFSDALDGSAAWRYVYKKTIAYLDAAKHLMTLPNGTPKTSKNYFYYAFSFIRLNNPGAVAELERQAADYKFFRSLTLLFLLEIPLSILDPFVTRDALFSRLAVSLLIACLAAVVAKLLFEWMYQLAFELYIELRASAKPPIKQP